MLRVLCILSLFFAQSTLANSPTPLHQTLSQLNRQIERAHFVDANKYSNELQTSSISYVNGVGAIFHFSYHQPLSKWTQLQQQSMKSEQEKIPVHIRSLTEEQVLESFNQLRLKAKELSHQAYSLERQLQSMAKELAHVEESKKPAQEEKIWLLEQQLRLVVTEKEQLKPQYDQLKQLHEKAQHTQQNKQTYLTFLAQLVSESLCQAAQLTQQLQPQDKVIFVLKSAGDKVVYGDDTSYKDISFYFEYPQMAQCFNGEISANDLLKPSQLQQF